MLLISLSLSSFFFFFFGSDKEIGTVTDRLQASQVAPFARPLELLNLLFACTNRPFKLTACQYKGPMSPIAKMWLFYQENTDLLGYLFNVGGLLSLPNFCETCELSSLELASRQDPSDDVVLGLLRMKSDAFSQTWHALSQGKSRHITENIVQTLASFCIVASLYVECLPRQLGIRFQDIQQSSKRLWNEICSFIARHETKFIHTCLELLYPIISPVVLSSDLYPAFSNGLMDIVGPLEEILGQRRQAQKRYASSISGELMEFDDSMFLHKDMIAAQTSIVDLNREALNLFPDAVTFERCMAIQLSIFKILSHEQPSETALVSFLTDLDCADILSAQSFLHRVYRACSTMERNDLLQILEDLAEKCLQSYELERCESSLCLCVRMSSSFAGSWTGEEGDNLSESALDIYSWFVDVLLAKKKATSRVYIALANFLECIAMSSAAYSRGRFNPSPRTCLFTILRDGDILVKFSVAGLITGVFSRIPLKEHDAVFDDVLGSLPHDPDWNEGIALRLFMLSRLASTWHTLLRRCIYHMFETPALIPCSIQYAGKCFRAVSATLEVSAQELFRLFSSQLTYTWTHAKSLNSMPFSVFGYSSLKELLFDVQDEVVGLVMMRANDSEARQLVHCVNVPLDRLVSESFYKAAAYCIARDISVPPEQEDHSKSVESRLRQVIGAERFVLLSEEHFPRTIAALFQSLDQYEQIQRAFSKRQNFHYAFSIMARITGKSTSKLPLPPNQQPSFRARYLIDELEFLCKRTGYELETIWTPALVSFVCRTLLESVRPALGSLHACSVIRKIRILVCIAGPVMLRDHQYEMTLHALRPFLTDIYCSEDALGIFWYLLEAGIPYLTENVHFTAGIVVPTLVSLRSFFTSSAQEPPPESQLAFESACKFRSWLAEFLDAYRPQMPGVKPELKKAMEGSFTRLVRSSQKFCAPGSAIKGTDESYLLAELLKDRTSKHSLLGRPLSDLVLSLLCVNFKRPRNYHSDIIEEDDDAIANSMAILETLRDIDCGTEYRLWAAKVIGRAFVATGKINDVLLREQVPLVSKGHESRLPPGIVYKSKARILQFLCDVLQNNDRLEAGLVERTLQLIASGLDGQHDLGDYPRVIPDALLKALIWNPYRCPALPLSASESRRGEVLDWDPRKPFADWACNIALYLSKAAEGDPVIGPLRKILNVIPSLAVQILPYIVHEVLLAEFDGERYTRHAISQIFRRVLCQVEENTIPHAFLVINCILYLRNQPCPGETTIVERDEWLDVDYEEASIAANKCRMRKTCLLFLEIQASRAAASSRRSSATKYSPPPDLLHDVFKEIDDPDFFYGLQEKPSLESVMERLDYEGGGIKDLLFRSAQYDSEIQLSANANAHGVLQALNSTNLEGLASAMSSCPSDMEESPAAFDSMLQSATSLQQWDIPVPPISRSPSAVMFKVFQNLNSAGTLCEVFSSLDASFLAMLDLLANTDKSAHSLRAGMRTLGCLTEISDILSSTSSEQVHGEWQKVTMRKTLLQTESFFDVREILNAREALTSSLKRQKYLRSAIGLTSGDAQLLEVKAIRESLKITRDHGISQASMKAAICLSNLVQPSSSLGIDIEGIAAFDLANNLWDQGEMVASIRMLKQLKAQNELEKHSAVSRAELLVTLVSQLYPLLPLLTKRLTN